MKKILKKIIITIITLEAKLVLLRFKPKIIAITGSVGKTSTKDAVFSALSDSIHIRKNQKSFNSEIGVPLTILGLDNGYNDFFKWLTNIFEGLLVLFTKKYPERLVLEVGVDRPGDMEHMMRWIKIDIAIFTRFPNVPAHVEYFSSPKEVINEKKKMLLGVKPDGYVVLNADDSEVLKIKDVCKRKVMTFGIENDADVKVSNEEIMYDSALRPTGVNFKVDYNKNSIPVKIKGVLGRQHIYPVLAGMICGIIEGITPVQVSEAMEKHQSAPGRMTILWGMKDSIIIDDSYNASPVAVQEALKVLGKIQSNGKKIAVLGDMSEIGKYTANEHKIIGKMVNDLHIDYLFTLGKRAEFFAEEAIKTGMSVENIFIFNEYGELTKKLKEVIEKGSIILIKGSQMIRAEKIVKEIMYEPELAKDLLVRQDIFWLDN